MARPLDIRINPFAALDGTHRKRLADVGRRLVLPAVRYELSDMPAPEVEGADVNRWRIRRLRRRARPAPVTTAPRELA